MRRVSIFYLVGLFDLWAGIRTLFISSAGAYLIAAYVDGPLMPWIAFVFLMGHMSANHIIRQFYVSRPDLVDITGKSVGLEINIWSVLTVNIGAQMVLIMKV